MAIDAHDGPAPVVLVGEATEDWSGDARFHEYSTAADPVGSGAIPPVPVARFPAGLHAWPGHPAGPPRPVRGPRRVGYPATSPALLAAFVVLDPGESLTTAPDATSELLLRDSRAPAAPSSAVRRARRRAAPPADIGHHRLGGRRRGDPARRVHRTPHAGPEGVPSSTG